MSKAKVTSQVSSAPTRVVGGQGDDIESERQRHTLRVSRISCGEKSLPLKQVGKIIQLVVRISGGIDKDEQVMYIIRRRQKSWNGLLRLRSNSLFAT